MASLKFEDLPEGDGDALGLVEEDHASHDQDEEVASTGGKKGKKKRDASALRKAPQAPKRFKSSYICFFMAKQLEIKDELGDKATVTEISKRSAQMWRTLPADQRAHWDDVAARDKQRYMMEKAAYTGPWQVPWKRAKKDPSAPKRPMSAFLYFSQGRRRQIKEANPKMKNTEVSRLLGEMWRNAPEHEKTPHIEKEKEEREKYKIAIADWRKEHEAKLESERKARAEQDAFMANMYAGGDPSHQAPPPHSMPPYGHDQNMMHAQYPPQHPGQPSHGPPQAQYSYGGAYPPYSYPPPPGPYQYPTNGKQPVILGPTGAPRYQPMAYSSGPSPSQQQQGPPIHQQHHQSHHGPPPHASYGPPPPQHGYEMPPQHYEYPPPDHSGMEQPQHQHPE